MGREGGVGRTGGLMLGKEVRAFDGIAMESSGEVWGFEYLLASLDPSMTPAELAVIPHLGDEAFDAFEKVLLLHRLSWSPHPGLRVAVTESALFYGRAPRLADVLPVLSQHDQYRDYDNLAWSFDAVWYPRPGLGVYGELMLDDLRAETLEGEGSDPSAFGLLAGVETSSGPWEAFVEAVYTSERLYRYDHPLGRWESRLRFGDLTASWIPDHDQPLGHRLGPDASGLFLGLARALRGGTRFSLTLSSRVHRTLPGPPGVLPRPIPLTDLDGPFGSRTGLREAVVGWSLPLWGRRGPRLEGSAALTRMESRSLDPAGPDPYARWLTGIEMAFLLPLL